MSILDYFRTSGTKQLVQQQLLLRDQLNRSLLRNLNRTPIWMDDTPSEYIHEGYQFNPDVYSVINQITKAASAVPFVVQRVTNKEKAEKYYRLKYSQRNGSGTNFVKKAKILKEEAFEEMPDSDLAKLLNNPNPLQSFPEWLENVLGFKLITGNSYIHGIELTDNRFGEMWIMPPQFTRIHADEELQTLVESYSVDLFGIHQRIPEDQVLHLKYWNPDFDVNGSHLYGQSPMRVLRRILKNSNEGQIALSKSFNNLGALGMLFPDDDEITELTDKQRGSLQKFFDNNAGGSENFKRALITTVKMGWQEFGSTPVELGVFENMKEARRIICNVYNGFPIILLNDSDSTTFNNVQEARKRLYLDIVVPELELFYTEMNSWLTEPYIDEEGREQPARFGEELFIDYDVSGIEALADDMSKKVDWLDRAWWIPPNMKLEEMSFDRIEDPSFDEPWIDMGRQPLSEALLREQIPDVAQEGRFEENGQEDE